MLLRARARRSRAGRRRGRSARRGLRRRGCRRPRMGGPGPAPHSAAAGPRDAARSQARRAPDMKTLALPGSGAHRGPGAPPSSVARPRRAERSGARAGPRGRGPGAGRAETAGRSPVWLVPRSPALGARMTASKRVAKELEELQKQLPQYLRNLRSEEDDVLVWHALLLPERPPYNLKAFSVCISFPREYPFQPPTVKFTTRIYHPNVDRDGRVCLPIISKKNWKASTRICQVLEALNMLVNRPEPGEPVRLELAEQLTHDPELFDRTAQEFTLQFGVDRPS